METNEIAITLRIEITITRTGWQGILACWRSIVADIYKKIFGAVKTIISPYEMKSKRDK